MQLPDWCSSPGLRPDPHPEGADAVAFHVIPESEAVWAPRGEDFAHKPGSVANDSWWRSLDEDIVTWVENSKIYSETGKEGIWW